MPAFTYEFEELEVEIDEVPVVISGCVEVEYDAERPQWSVGFSGGVEITDISDAVFDILDQDEPGFDYTDMTASKNTPLWNQITRAIMPKLLNAASDDAQN